MSTYAEALDDEHTLAREMVVETEHADAGTIKMLGIPVKLSDTPGAVRRPPPRLGEHTEEILANLVTVPARSPSSATRGRSPPREPLPRRPA